MKLISKEKLSIGSCLPNSWIAFGKTDSYIPGVTKYLNIRIPLFILKWADWFEPPLHDRFGWWTPVLLIRYGRNVVAFQIGMSFHSDFMNEPLYKDRFTGKEVSDPYDYSKIYKG